MQTQKIKVKPLPDSDYVFYILLECYEINEYRNKKPTGKVTQYRKVFDVLRCPEARNLIGFTSNKAKEWLKIKYPLHTLAIETAPESLL